MARQKYGYAESSALRATNWGGHTLSAIDEKNILENGMLVKSIGSTHNIVSGGYSIISVMKDFPLSF